MEKVGFVDPIFVRDLHDGTYRVVGGHHRWDVAKLLDFVTVPCTIIDSDDFDDDQEKFQVVRMNVIRGKMSPKKFFDLYQSMGDKYSDEIAAELFGFAKQEEFDKLVGQMAASLPKGAQEEFKKAAAEIKTVDGLSKLLNTMFTKYGDTLPFNYMLIDFAGKESVWLRMQASEKKNLISLGSECMKSSVTLDSVVAGMIKHLMGPDGEQLRHKLVGQGVKAQFPKGTEIPIAEVAT
jgi:hypothetical protein